MNNTTVLITGGSGLAGRHLTSMLLAERYTVAHLSRKQAQFGKVRVFRWDPEKEIIDPVIFDGVDYIIHLAGANISEKRWTKKRKQEIVTSRVDSAKLLHKIVIENAVDLKAFISASAIGYYGTLTSEKIFTEEDPPANDFLGTTCKLWEEAADMFEQSGIRTVKIRSAMVLEKSDSALTKLMTAAKWHLFPVLGGGRQYMPWIHISDLCNIYLKALQDDKMEGAYNAVAPQHVTFREFMSSLASAMNKSGFRPTVSSVLLKIILGEMADILLNGSRVSSGKIIKTGCQFTFDSLDKALKDLFKQ